MVSFTHNNTPYSEEFKDIYYNEINGLEESSHVFIKGNGLPEAWAEYETTTIIETGFGTGLNFLNCWRAFEQTQRKGQRLHFMSVEKHPLSPEEISKSLEKWHGIFDEKLDLLLTHYPLRIPGFHKIILNDTVELLLIFEDIADALPKIATQADFWFLDGFSPSTNPEMWQESLYTNIQRLSHSKTRLATFTAAGHVRRGLASAGFDIQKIPGYGRKREMSIGVSQNTQKRLPVSRPEKKISIMGGGLAGCAAGYILNQYGYTVTLYEKNVDLALGASGNEIGLVNPKLGVTGSIMQDYHTSAYAQSIREVERLGLMTRCGSLHVAQHAKRLEKFNKFITKSNWHKDHARWIDAKETKDISGLALDYGGIYLPDSGITSPVELCRAYTKEIDVKCNQDYTALETDQKSLTIMACAYESKRFMPALELQPIKGQTTYIKTILPNKTNICYGGYLSPSLNGQHCLGASFHRNQNDTQYQHDDDKKNIDQLSAILGQNLEGEIRKSWVGVRCSSRDKYPIIGAYSDTMYTSIAHGSHGIISSLMAAHILAYQLGIGVQPVGQHVLNQLSPYRFTASEPPA